MGNDAGKPEAMQPGGLEVKSWKMGAQASIVDDEMSHAGHLNDVAGKLPV